MLIHAGLNRRRLFNPRVWAWLEKEHRVRPPEELYFGGVVGVVDIMDCGTRHKSPWFEGTFGYVLANPLRLPFRPCQGKLGFSGRGSSAIEPRHRAATKEPTWATKPS